MLQSKLFLKTRKEDPSGEEAANAKLLIRGHFIEKLMAGVYSMLPLGLRVKRRVENIIREEMNALGGNEVLMPALHPKSVWEATNRWDEAEGIMYKMKDGRGKDVGLGFTHEEIVVHLAKTGVSSYVDLPLYLYQIQTKFRDEERPKSGLLRGREFTMKDLYSFHVDNDSLDDFYEESKDSYLKIFERAGLGDITHTTFASGGVFSKYSHEFQTISPVGEDIIFLCEKCGIGVNKEIIDDQSDCPECGNSNLEEKTAIEVGNIFKLGTRFSEAANLFYKDDKGESHPVVMGSYGIGVERLMGTIVEIFHDEKGIIWPESVAPFRAHLLLVGESGGELQKFAERAYNELISSGVEVLFDDRPIRAGEKFADADLVGIPYRIVASKKTMENNKLEVKRRDEEEVELMKLEEIIQRLA